MRVLKRQINTVFNALCLPACELADTRKKEREGGTESESEKREMAKTKAVWLLSCISPISSRAADLVYEVC